MATKARINAALASYSSLSTIRTMHIKTNTDPLPPPPNKLSALSHALPPSVVHLHIELSIQRTVLASRSCSTSQKKKNPDVGQMHNGELVCASV